MRFLTGRNAGVRAFSALSAVRDNYVVIEVRPLFREGGCRLSKTKQILRSAEDDTFGVNLGSYACVILARAVAWRFGVAGKLGLVLC